MNRLKTVQSRHYCLIFVISIIVTILLYGKLVEYLSENSLIVSKDDSFGNHQRLLSEKGPRQTSYSDSSFNGDRVRQFTGNRRKFRLITPEFTPDNSSVYEERQQGKRNCTNWAVVRTIREPSEAIRRMLYLINSPSSSWCLVIVGDLYLPSPSYEFVTTLANHKNVIFLNSDEQLKISRKTAGTHGGKFVASLPWHSFGRKNVGFAYAITQKPTPAFIWDFGDDNQLKFWIPHANMHDLQSLDNIINRLSRSDFVEVTSVNASSYRQSYQFPKDDIKTEKETLSNENESKMDVVFNPYPVLGCPMPNCWPRGIPLSQVETMNFKFNLSNQNVYSWLLPPHRVKSSTISIVQSVADHQPDVDAVFRSKVSDQPFSFGQGDASFKNIDNLLMVSKGLVVPMNAQATLHAKSAFFSLYLPWTVNVRISDIWRSYVAQAILSLTDHAVAFAPLPLVDQDSSNDDEDLMSNLDDEHLLKQINVLIARLSEWKLKQYDNFVRLADTNVLTPAEFFTQNLAALMEDLYIELYERQFVEEGDVISVQYWLQLLTCYGYTQQSHDAKDCQKSSWDYGIQPVLPRYKLEQFAHLGNPEDDYTFSTCPPVTSGKSLTSPEVKQLTFVTSDFHAATRLDIPTLLASLGHRTIIAGLNEKERYPQVFSRRYSASNQDLLIDLSDKTVEGVSNGFGEAVFNFFTNTSYGKNLIDQADVFTYSFPPSLFRTWISFFLPENQARNQSFIMAPAHRYNIGSCTVKEWTEQNEQIKTLLSSSHRTHIAGGMSRYDLEYIHHYTGIKKRPNGYTPGNNKDAHLDRSRQILVHLIPTMTYFYTRPDIEQESDAFQKRTTLLIFNMERLPMPRSLIRELELQFDSLKGRNIDVKYARRDLKKYTLTQLTRYGAILYFPYSVLSYKFVEFYSLNIPLLVPSLKYYKGKFPFGHDRTVNKRCQSDTIGLEMMKASNSAHQYNPNIMSNSKLPMDKIEKKQHELYWLQFSDFYDFPHVILFDNVTHLGDLFTEFTDNNGGRHFMNVKRLMEEENKMRRYFALVKTWCPILEDITRSRYDAH